VSLNEYLVFLGVVLVATISPGPAVFLALKNGARHSYFKALFGVLGNITALLIFASLSAVGLGAVLLASPELFLVIKLVGSIYLCYLGVKLWWARATPHTPSLDESLDLPTTSNLTVYQEGLLVGITNPKTIIFFAALFPQFISLELGLSPKGFLPNSFLLQFSLLAITIAFFSFLFLALYTALSSSVREFLNRPQVMKVFNKVIGTVFIGYGIGLLFYGK